MKQARVGRGAQAFEVRLPGAMAVALKRLSKRGEVSQNWHFIEAMRAYLATQGESEREGGTAD